MAGITLRTQEHKRGEKHFDNDMLIDPDVQGEVAVTALSRKPPLMIVHAHGIL